MELLVRGGDIQRGGGLKKTSKNVREPIDVKHYWFNVGDGYVKQ